MRIRMEGVPHRYHEDHIAGKGTNSSSHYNPVHKLINSFASSNKNAGSELEPQFRKHKGRVVRTFAVQFCSCPHTPALAILCPLEEWCRAMATDIRSCRNMERSRRSLRRRATPLDCGRPLGPAMNNGQLCKKRQRATCLSLVVVVVVRT